MSSLYLSFFPSRKRLPLDERRIASFARQTVLQLKRAYLQIGRQILQLAFDIGLPFFTGISTALVFFSSQWTPPLTENAPVARALFGCYDCVHPFAAVPSVSMAQKNAICHLISLADDPYARLSLMASMVSSSKISSLATFVTKLVYPF